MNKRYFVVVAEALAAVKPEHPGLSAHVQWQIDCHRVALAFRSLNRAFDVNLFLANCGIESEVTP